MVSENTSGSSEGTQHEARTRVADPGLRTKTLLIAFHSRSYGDVNLESQMVFSGIVEEMGTVVSLVSRNDMTLWDGSKGAGTELTIKCAVAVQDGCYIGASIAVNGTCLTVTSFTKETFTVGLAPETLRRTNLGSIKAGVKVNLERALANNGRNSGHYVQGHVDGTGTISKFWKEGDSLWVQVTTDPSIMSGIVTKGFIAVDGTSLTVCDVNYAENFFTFMLVAYTQQHIVIPLKKEGETVNLETDVLGKYVARSIEAVNDRVKAVEKKVDTLFITSDSLGHNVLKLERKASSSSFHEGSPDDGHNKGILKASKYLFVANTALVLGCFGYSVYKYVKKV